MPASRWTTSITVMPIPRTQDASPVESLLPDAAFAARRGDVAESAMYPVEAAVVAEAVAERRREFGTVRHCAREAMRRLGVPATSILPDPDRVPTWPAGVVGSLTHCPGFRAAGVARREHWSSLGIDAEPHAPLPEQVRDLVIRSDEGAWLSRLASHRPDRHWDRVLFCAKEAAYKAWFPLTRQWLDFADVRICVREEGTFKAHIVRSARRRGSVPTYLAGRWIVDAGVVVAATSVSGEGGGR